MSAISGERTSVGSGRSIAASWYVSDLPDPVGMSASVSRPAIAARTTSSCPGRKASKPKSSRSGERRSVRRASIGGASGDPVSTSPIQVQRTSSVPRSRVSWKAVLGNLVPVARLVRVDVRCDAKPGRAGERPRCDADPLPAGRLPEEARAAHAAEAAPRMSIALGAVDPTKCLGRADHEVVDPRRRERAHGAGPATTLDAVADDDVAKRPPDLVGHGAAQTASRRARFRHGRNIRIAGCRSSPTT